MKSSNVVNFTGNIEYLKEHNVINVRGYLSKKGKSIDGKYYIENTDAQGGKLVGTVSEDSILKLNTFRVENGVEILKSSISGTLGKGPILLNGKNGPGDKVRWSISIN